MTNVNELKDALKDTLQERGELNKIKAMMRAAIFEAIETDDKPKPKLGDENLIINELIREYLKYNNYLHTNSVFTAESGQPVDPPFDRNFISKELNIVEDQSSKKLPLLYSILFGLKKEVYDPNALVYDNLNNNPNANSNQLNSNATSNPYNSKHNYVPNKFKEQSINMNMNSNNQNMSMNNTAGKNNNNDSKIYFEKKDQPQPWIID